MSVLRFSKRSFAILVSLIFCLSLPVRAELLCVQHMGDGTNSAQSVNPQTKIELGSTTEHVSGEHSLTGQSLPPQSHSTHSPCGSHPIATATAVVDSAANHLEAGNHHCPDDCPEQGHCGSSATALLLSNPFLTLPRVTHRYQELSVAVPNHLLFPDKRPPKV